MGNADTKHKSIDLLSVLLSSDTMYVLGDIIDKGSSSIKLVDYIRCKPNIKAILGNHEFIFLKYYDGLMRSAKNASDINKCNKNISVELLLNNTCSDMVNSLIAL